MRKVQSDFAIRLIGVPLTQFERKIDDVGAGDDVTLRDQKSTADDFFVSIEDANDGWFKLIAHPARDPLVWRLPEAVWIHANPPTAAGGLFEFDLQSESPQRQLGDCSSPTYCHRSLENA